LQNKERGRREEEETSKVKVNADGENPIYIRENNSKPLDEIKRNMIN
jgi:hypothetical protein